jgi:hypothetical protein
MTGVYAVQAPQPPEGTFQNGDFPPRPTLIEVKRGREKARISIMKQRTLRAWHRNIGIIIALFVFFQVGSGFLIALVDFSPQDSQAHEDRPEEKPEPTGHGHQDDAIFTRGLAFVHHGTPAILGIYRILLGAAILVQAGLGVVIYFKMESVSSKQSG